MKKADRVAAVGLIFQSVDDRLDSFLLTERSSELKQHAGQVALPGGLLDAAERDHPLRGLDREVSEEVGIPEGAVDWHPRPWDSVLSIFGIHVLPFWGVLKIPATQAPLVIDPSEVARAAWLSTDSLFKDSLWENRQYFHKNRNGSHASELMPVFKGWDVETWGLTAILLAIFLRRISGGEPY